MKVEILTSYQELKELGDNSKYSIHQVSWWLLKYGDLYKKVFQSYNKLCDTCLKRRAENLYITCFLKQVNCNKIPEYQEFIKFYNELDVVTELYKLEEKCYMAYDEYMTFLCIDEDLRDWVIKYYDLYSKIGVHFYTFLMFNSDGIKTLHISDAPDESFGVIIREDDFKSSVRFYDVYFDLYENKKLYPEKLKEWDEIFSKIPSEKKDL
ncbi:hypothetical protein ABGT15_08985 [Flavobacterium enshiense]|uniref:hypothetical protein n=1 Tax=Flavobacterium enshiense TaxID=1341165 RepID=UPI00345C7521